MQDLVSHDPFPGIPWNWIDIGKDGEYGSCLSASPEGKKILKQLIPPGRYRHAIKHDSAYSEFIVNEDNNLVMFCVAD
jgi:hypothetical protein